MTNFDKKKLVRIKAVLASDLKNQVNTDYYVFDLVIDENYNPSGETETLGYYCFQVRREYTHRKPIRILPGLFFLDYEIVLDGHGNKREIEHRNRISGNIVAKVGCRFLMWVDDEYEYEIVEVIDVV